MGQAWRRLDECFPSGVHPHLSGLHGEGGSSSCMQTFLRSDWAHSAEDAPEMPARFASFCLISEWLAAGGEAAREAGAAGAGAAGDGPAPSHRDPCAMGGAHAPGSALTLAGLCAAVIAQGLVEEGKAIVQRSPSFACSLPALKALVVQRLKRACTRDALSRRLVLEGLLTILIVRSLSLDLLKRPENPRQLLLPLWHLNRGQRTRGSAGGGGFMVECRWMGRRPGSVGTLASVLALGELVEMAVLIGREDSARDLLPMLLLRIVRHPLGLQV